MVCSAGRTSSSGAAAAAAAATSAVCSGAARGFIKFVVTVINARGAVSAMRYLERRGERRDNHELGREVSDDLLQTACEARVAVRAERRALVVLPGPETIVLDY